MYVGSKSTTVAVGRPDKQNRCRTEECEELHLRRGSPLACGVIGFASSCGSDFIAFLELTYGNLFLTSTVSNEILLEGLTYFARFEVVSQEELLY